MWLVIWGALTASLRPLSGEPFAELIERAGNFGAPTALLLITGFPNSFRELFTRIRITTIQPDETMLAKLTMCLRAVVFFLLLGHGWLNIIEKKGLINQYISLGINDPAQLAQVIGTLEIIAALYSVDQTSPFFSACIFCVEGV